MPKHFDRQRIRRIVDVEKKEIEEIGHSSIGTE
jgi:hypothetical protein